MDFLFDLLGRNTPPAVYAGGSFNNASEILPPEGQMQDNEPTIELDVNECQPRKRVEEALVRINVHSHSEDHLRPHRKRLIGRLGPRRKRSTGRHYVLHLTISMRLSKR